MTDKSSVIAIRWKWRNFSSDIVLHCLGTSSQQQQQHPPLGWLSNERLLGVLMNANQDAAEDARRRRSVKGIQGVGYWTADWQQQQQQQGTRNSSLSQLVITIEPSRAIELHCAIVCDCWCCCWRPPPSPNKIDKKQNKKQEKEEKTTTSKGYRNINIQNSLSDTFCKVEMLKTRRKQKLLKKNLKSTTRTKQKKKEENCYRFILL